MSANYNTKKELKENIGKPLDYTETSMFGGVGAEYKENGSFCVVGPYAYDRKWFATTVMKNGLIVKVS